VGRRGFAGVVVGRARGGGHPEHGWLAAAAAAAAAASAWRGTARRGETRRGEARDGTRRRGTRRGAAWNVRRGVGGSVGRLACLLTRALACGYVRSSPIPVLCFSLLLSFCLCDEPRPLAPSRLSSSRRAFVSLRAVLLPSHREAASKQEPIWISVDLFLLSPSLPLSLSLSLYLLLLSLPPLFFNQFPFDSPVRTFSK